MIRRALLALVVLGGIAHAEAVKAPLGWGIDHEMADALASRASGVPHFGDAQAIAIARVFRAPGQPVTLYVTRVEANVKTGRDVAATAELDEVRGAMRRAGLKPEAESQRSDAVTKQLEAAVSWRDTSLGIATSSRIVIAGDAQRLVAVLGECVSPLGVDADAVKTLVATCNLALATLDTDVDPATRVPLEIVDVTAGVDPTAAAAAKAGSGRSNPFEAPRLDATGPRPAMPPMTIAAPESDRRPIYIGAGILVLALLFWWNRQRRERFEREDAKTDEDADDLHAAAEDQEQEKDKS